jgi:hypothetical protein
MTEKSSGVKYESSLKTTIMSRQQSNVSAISHQPRAKKLSRLPIRAILYTKRLRLNALNFNWMNRIVESIKAPCGCGRL